MGGYKSGKWFFMLKSGKWRGCFFVKSGPFLNAWCIMCSISIFYFTFYLFGGAYAPPAYGPELEPSYSGWRISDG